MSANGGLRPAFYFQFENFLEVWFPRLLNVGSGCKSRHQKPTFAWGGKGFRSMDGFEETSLRMAQEEPGLSAKAGEAVSDSGSPAGTPANFDQLNACLRDYFAVEDEDFIRFMSENSSILELYAGDVLIEQGARDDDVDRRDRSPACARRRGARGFGDQREQRDEGDVRERREREAAPRVRPDVARLRRVGSCGVECGHGGPRREAPRPCRTRPHPAVYRDTRKPRTRPMPRPVSPHWG